VATGGVRNLKGGGWVEEEKDVVVPLSLGIPIASLPRLNTDHTLPLPNISLSCNLQLSIRGFNQGFCFPKPKRTLLTPFPTTDVSFSNNYNVIQSNKCSLDSSQF